MMWNQSVSCCCYIRRFASRRESQASAISRLLGIATGLRDRPPSPMVCFSAMGKGRAAFIRHAGFPPVAQSIHDRFCWLATFIFPVFCFLVVWAPFVQRCCYQCGTYLEEFGEDLLQWASNLVGTDWGSRGGVCVLGLVSFQSGIFPSIGKNNI